LIENTGLAEWLEKSGSVRSYINQNRQIITNVTVLITTTFLNKLI